MSLLPPSIPLSLLYPLFLPPQTRNEGWGDEGGEGNEGATEGNGERVGEVERKKRVGKKGGERERQRRRG